MGIKNNVILIVSDEFDLSTNMVIEWLIHFNETFFRINAEDEVLIEYVTISNSESDFKITVRDKEVSLSDVKSCWFRRDLFSLDKSFNIKFIETAIRENSTANKLLNEFLSSEYIKLKEYFVFLLENSLDGICLGNPKKSSDNKLIHLEVAKRLGLNIPDTSIARDITTLNHKGANIITKAIADFPFLTIWENEDKHNFLSYTTLVDDFEFKSSHPSLYQEEIAKAIELRIFYICGEFYAMAIFSQNNPNTSLDFRHYDVNNPNKTVPYSLPGDIKTQLQNFMKTTNHNTGSIDMLVDTNGKYIFLEMNPSGQFGMVSIPCNYHIEKKIAKVLSNNNR